MAFVIENYTNDFSFMIDWKYLRKGGERTVQGAFGLQGAYVQKRQTLNLVNWVK